MNSTELMTDVENKLENIFDGTSYKDYLKVVGRITHYSFFNQVLIYSKQKNAVHVASPTVWKKLGRAIKKGTDNGSEIALLAPKTKTVYKDNEENVINRGLFTNNQLQSAINSGIVRKEKSISGHSVIYVYDISKTEGDNVDHIINAVQDKYKEIGTAGIHSILEKLYGETFENKDKTKAASMIRTTVDRLIEKRKKDAVLSLIVTSKRETSLISESVAYSVCSRLGEDTNEFKFDFIQAWFNSHKDNEEGRDTIKRCLDYIARFTNEIIVALQNELGLEELKATEEMESKEALKEDITLAAFADYVRGLVFRR